MYRQKTKTHFVNGSDCGSNYYLDNEYVGKYKLKTSPQ